jgi:hypothetical protein
MQNEHSMLCNKGERRAIMSKTNKKQVSLAEVLGFINTNYKLELTEETLIAKLLYTPPEPKAPKVGGKRKFYVRTDVPCLVAPKQEKQCLKALSTDKATDLETWGKDSLEEGVVTVQPISRIIGYYLPDMKAKGYITEVPEGWVKPEDETEEETDETEEETDETEEETEETEEETDK